jgi:thiol:disulfide interchange protein DsbD
MRTVRALLLLIFTASLAASAFGQPKSDKVAWTGKLEPADARAGEAAQLILTATVVDGWHIYALKGPEGPAYTSFVVPKTPAFAKVGDAVEPAAHVAFDQGFKANIGTHSGTVSFAIPVQLAAGLKGPQKVVVSATAQACNSQTCEIPTPIDVPISFTPAAGPVRADHTKLAAAAPAPAAGTQEPAAAVQSGTVDAVATQIQHAESQGLIAYIWLSFVFGLLALLTPCVWPMVPITVSFFSKRADEGSRANLKGAVAYCLGIMGTFTAIGLVVTLLFGAAGVQKLAANPYINVGLGLLFVVLALNLFGVFEIIVPQGILAKAQSGTGKGGLIGPILMGLTFSLTTFTCTVPFVGTLLVAAAKGSWGFPIAGMLAFSFAFAVPFFFLALFPRYLARLPKSGSWLIAVKAYMGFLELAAALKFLSNAELVWLLGWLTRPVFLAIWFAIFAVGGLYLLGWLLLPHGAGAIKVGPIRRLIGVGTIAIAFYWLAAIQGAPTGEFSGFLPPDPYPGKSTAGEKIPFGSDLQAALAQARSEHKAVFINFTGYTCTNCRVMEGSVFPRPEVAKGINAFVPVELYTDNGSSVDNANATLREKLTGASTNPTYVIVAPDQTVLKVFQGLAMNENDYLLFLKDGKDAADKWFSLRAER